MTEQKQVFNNIVGIERQQREDGKPAAILALRSMRANSNPNVRAVKGGRVAISFPANISADEYKKKALRYAMNGMVLPEYNGRISVNVVMFIDENSKFKDWVLSRLEKGSLIPMMLGRLETNTYTKDNETHTTLNLTVDPSNIITIKAPETDGDGDGAESTGSAPNFNMSEDDLPF